MKSNAERHILDSVLTSVAPAASTRRSSRDVEHLRSVVKSASFTTSRGPSPSVSPRRFDCRAVHKHPTPRRRRNHPVPMAKMCMPVRPEPTWKPTLGKVTDATVFAASTGTLISNTDTVSCCDEPPIELRYGIVAAVFSSAAGPPAQSLTSNVAVVVLPSVYVMVTGPDESPFVDVTRNPTLLAPACAGSRISWPAASTLSGWQAATSGQVNVTPPEVTVPPCVTPACASASADRLNPTPSRFAHAWLASELMPVLS